MLLLPVLLAFTPLVDRDDAHREALSHYGYSRWLAGNQQLASAAAQLEQAAKLDSEALAPRRDLVQIYAELGRDAAAIRLARQILVANPADATTAQTLARLLQNAKQHREAGDVIGTALDAPKLPPHRRLSLLRDLARFRKQSRDWPAARTALETLLKYLADEENALLRDGFDRGDLIRERGAASEQLGHVHTELQQFREAIAAYEQAATLFANEPNAAARLNWNLSGVYATANEPAKAIAALESFLKFKPKNVAPYRRYAELLRKTHRGTEATLSSLAEHNPSIPAIRWVATAELARRDFPSAHVRFLELLSTTTEDAFFVLLVDTYREQNRAAELLAVAEELFPIVGARTVVPASQSDRQQAFANALGKDLSLAAALLQATHNARPRSSQLWELLGWLAERADLSDELERALSNALSVAGNDPSATAFDRLATHLSRQRKWTKLLELCDQLRDFEAYRAILRSEALVELGRGDEALAALQATQNFANFPSRRQRAHILGILGRYAEMLKTLDAMLVDFKTPSDVTRIHYLRAEALAGLDRFDEAEAQLRQILEDDPDDVLALNNLGYNLAERNRKLPEAEALIRLALELDRRERARSGEARLENAAYLDSLGWVLFRRGQLAAARVELEKAVKLPDGRADGLVWDHLGDVCFRLGDKPAAKAAWQHADKKLVGDHRGRIGGRAEDVKRKLKLVE